MYRGELANLCGSNCASTTLRESRRAVARAADWQKYFPPQSPATFPRIEFIE